MFFQSSEDVGSRVQKMLVPEFRRCLFQSSEKKRFTTSEKKRFTTECIL